MNPTLSIAIPVYNFAEYLTHTLDSIIKQAKLHNIEVLIYDGASSDATSTIIKSYLNSYENLRYIRSLKKGGIDLDMAKCIDLVRGNYCWLFSGDDLMHSNSVERVLNYLSSWKPDLLLLRHNECDVNMDVICEWSVLSIETDNLFDLSEIQSRKNFLEAAITSEAFFSFMGGLIVKRSKWLKGKFDNDFAGSNWEHIFRIWGLTNKKFKLGYVHKPILDRRGGNDSFSSDGSLSRLSIQIDGLLNTLLRIYNKDSIEIETLKRVLNYEINGGWLTAVEQDLIKDEAPKSSFDKLKNMVYRIS